MLFKKLSAPSLKELFVAELEGMILSGKLEIGAKLPPERELAESMQVSRAVVNAGIADMEKKGFLVVKPRIGTFVADYRRYGTTDTLVSIMHYNGGMLRDKEVRSILEVRIIFMNLAATLAIDNADDAAIASLERYVQALKQSEDPEETASLIFEFSHELSFISGNSLLPLFFISFKDLVINLWVRYANAYGCASLAESAATIYQYVAARDKDSVTAYITESTNASIDGDRQIYTKM
ncbi:MAG: FadR family transcriptional regulator [Roseburia sp.]|nr:FadR family transcriptional regulator [Roseburia sp.]